MAKGGGIGGFAKELGVAGVVIAILLYVVVTIKSTVASPSADFNTTLDNTVTAGKNITTWFAILVVAVMGFLTLRNFGGGKA